jgi:hypothetical protein
VIDAALVTPASDASIWPALFGTLLGALIGGGATVTASS